MIDELEPASRASNGTSRWGQSESTCRRWLSQLGLRVGLVALVASSVAVFGATSPTHAAEPEPELVETTVSDLGALLGSDELVPDVPTEAGHVVPDETADGLTVSAGDGAATFTMHLPIEADAFVTDGGSIGYVEPDAGVGLVIQGVTDSELVEGVSSGLRTLITIADENASTRYEFPLELADGHRLVFGDDGAAFITNNSGGVTSVLPPPWALDAAGNDLPTWYEIEGSTLVQQVLHHGATYPVIADPVWFIPVVVGVAKVAAKVAVRASSNAAARQAAFAAARSQIGEELVGITGPIVQQGFLAATRANFRHNLIVKTARNPRWCHAHHIIPQILERWAWERGVNIHDPEHLTWWNSTSGLWGNHQSMAAEYNER